MGDWFQTIVDPTISEGEALTRGFRVREWLVAREVLDSTPRDCALNGDGMGSPPGRRWREAVLDPEPLFLQLRTNGMAIVAGPRTVFDAGQGSHQLTCPTCSRRREFTAPVGEAIGEWWEGGVGTLECAACGTNSSVVTWSFDPPWGFGRLGWVFWNWPRLAPEFVKQIEDFVSTRLVFVAGKL